MRRNNSDVRLSFTGSPEPFNEDHVPLYFWAGLCSCVIQKETEGQVSVSRGGARCCEGEGAVLR